MLNRTLSGFFFLTGLTETNELKQVTIYPEPGLLDEALSHFPQIATGEISNPAAIGADQVVVVPWSTNCIAVAAASGV